MRVETICREGKDKRVALNYCYAATLLILQRSTTRGNPTGLRFCTQCKCSYIYILLNIPAAAVYMPYIQKLNCH